MWRVLVALADASTEPLLTMRLLHDAAMAGDPDAAVIRLAAMAASTRARPEIRDEAARLMLMVDPYRSVGAQTALRSPIADPALVNGQSAWLRSI